MCLANGLSILFIFTKNQLLTLLFFATMFFISFSFVSALVFMISFLLLTLGFFKAVSLNCHDAKTKNNYHDTNDQGDPGSPSSRRSVLNIHWKD